MQNNINLGSKLTKFKTISKLNKTEILREIFSYHDSKHTFNYWMKPRKFKNLISTLYIDYKHKNNQCCICQKSFHNNLVRDFHINMIHQIEIYYSCEHCKIDDIECDTYFTDIYQYFDHQFKYHTDDNKSTNILIG